MKWGLAAAVASAAAVAAASGAELVACDCDASAAAVGRCDELHSRDHYDNKEGPHRPASASREMPRRGGHVSGVDRFAPRFDGLRFIETLVTAHR
ncbi:hypothetical protein QOZ80_2AG0120820 [Eleusine coracana subsp. coracana]|nr:hypothetical protein QOZ80_2AG0120820 [Eleusine coracana subsp. coracana]